MLANTNMGMSVCTFMQHMHVHTHPAAHVCVHGQELPLWRLPPRAGLRPDLPALPGGVFIGKMKINSSSTERHLIPNKTQRQNILISHRLKPSQELSIPAACCTKKPICPSAQLW